MPTILFVELDFGPKIGQAFRETDRNDSSEAHVVADIVSGQIDTPIIRILAVRVGEITRDVTSEIGDLVFQHFAGMYDGFGRIPEVAKDLAERAGHDIDGLFAASEDEAAAHARHIKSLRPDVRTHLGRIS